MPSSLPPSAHRVSVRRQSRPGLRVTLPERTVRFAVVSSAFEQGQFRDAERLLEAGEPSATDVVSHVDQGALVFRVAASIELGRIISDGRLKYADLLDLNGGDSMAEDDVDNDLVRQASPSGGLAAPVVQKVNKSARASLTIHAAYAFPSIAVPCWQTRTSVAEQKSESTTATRWSSFSAAQPRLSAAQPH